MGCPCPLTGAGCSVRTAASRLAQSYARNLGLGAVFMTLVLLEMGLTGPVGVGGLPPLPGPAGGSLGRYLDGMGGPSGQTCGDAVDR